MDTAGMILGIVQARMSSTRLPGKVMKKVLGKPLIGFLLERLKRAERIDKIIVATSTDKSNDEMCDYLKSIDVDVFRGDEEDVLDRYYKAAVHYQAKVVVRITGDAPLLEPILVDKIVELFLDKNVDYASNVFPPTYPDGLDVEVFSFQALEKCWRLAKLPSEREHVTALIQKDDQFSKFNLAHDADLSKERWTLDNPEDYELIKSIFICLYQKIPDFSIDDILNLKKEQPALFVINKHINRNQGYLKSLLKDEGFVKHA